MQITTEIHRFCEDAEAFGLPFCEDASSIFAVLKHSGDHFECRLRLESIDFFFLKDFYAHLPRAECDFGEKKGGNLRKRPAEYAGVSL